MLATSRLSVRVAQRAVVVAGQRQAAVTAIRSRRSIQSVAQTDRVDFPSQLFFSAVFLIKPLGHHY